MTHSSTSGVFREPGAELEGLFAGGDENGFWRELRAAQVRPVLSRLAGYDGLEEVGRGGQGTVYRARTRPGAVPVALKRVRAGRWASASERARFEREARLARRLRHPGIVRVLALEEVAGGPMLVTEWIDGERIDHWARTATSERRFATFVRLCAAVAHAHGRGVVHRDLKPENVLVDRDDQPHVLDFGIARRIVPSGDRSDPCDTSGTPAYAAPEQSRGWGACRPQVDVYALGRVGQELLGASQTPAIAEVLARALAHDPGQRHRDAAALCGAVLLDRADLLADLGELLGAQGGTVRFEGLQETLRL